MRLFTKLITQIQYILERNKEKLEERFAWEEAKKYKWGQTTRVGTKFWLWGTDFVLGTTRLQVKTQGRLVSTRSELWIRLVWFPSDTHSKKQINQKRELLHSLHFYTREAIWSDKNQQSPTGNTGSDRSDLGERTQSKDLGDMARNNLDLLRKSEKGEAMQGPPSPHSPAAAAGSAIN